MRREPVSVLLTGDALITRPYLADSPERQGFVDLVQGVDAALTNVEAPFNDFAGPPAHGIGIHLSAAAQRARELQQVGFNLFAAANNHALDYGIDGLRRHMAVMRELGMAYAGVGEDATEAARAAFIDTPNGRVALVACASSLGAGWPAADPGAGVEARPGVNALGFSTTYTLDPGRFAALREIAGSLGLTQHERYDLDMGYALPLTDPGRSTRLFGGLVTLGDPPGVTSHPDAVDLARITAAVAAARDSADLVLVYLHTQEHESSADQPAAFVRAFAHECIDAGAHLVSASGPHVMRGVELYRNSPILHGLGNLWFQYDQLAHLPPDSLAVYGLPPTATPQEFADTALLGFRRDPRYWHSAVAHCTFAGDRLSALTLHPVTSGYGLPAQRRGAPELAAPEPAARILDEVTRLCTQLGTELRVQKGLGHLTF